MLRPIRTTPRSWLSLFFRFGGVIGCALLLWAAMMTAHQFREGDSNGLLWWACVAGGTGLVWWASRMAWDAVNARKSGVERVTYVFQVKRIQSSHGWESFFPQGRLTWLDNARGECRTTLHPWSTIRVWSPGDEMIVFEGRHRVWWSGDVGPRTVVKSRLPKVPAHPAE